MAKNVVLAGNELAWARGIFSGYYSRKPVAPPSRLTRREFAAFPFATETMMRRHATLRTPEEFQTFLAREVPRHVYYSSAYYRHPAQTSMAAKEWLGADLIFDLDADHLRGAESLDYAGQLRLVKTRLTELVDDFLFGDFGIDPAATDLVFSGGRGYHVHVHDERFLGLNSPERRELVDYVLGTGFDPMQVIVGRREDVRSGRVAAEAEDESSGATPRSRSALQLRGLSPPEAPGWRGRTTRALFALFDRWAATGVETARAEMESWGIPKAKARTWAKLLVEQGGAERIRSTLSLDVFRKEVPAEILEAVVAHVKIDVQGETDAPVTTDIHRLIRLPNSLHGGTGFRVVPLDRERIASFDPFAEALLPLPDDAVSVTFREDVDYPFPPSGLKGSAGSSDELPTPLALFLVLRGEAELRPSPA